MLALLRVLALLRMLAISTRVTPGHFLLDLSDISERSGTRPGLEEEGNFPPSKRPGKVLGGFYFLKWAKRKLLY